MLLSEDKDNDFFVLTVDSGHWKVRVSLRVICNMPQMCCCPCKGRHGGDCNSGTPCRAFGETRCCSKFPKLASLQTHALGPTAALACAPLLLAAWRVGGAQILLE